MAALTRSARASIDASTGMFTQTFTGGRSAGTIPAVCACKINSNGTVAIAAATDAIVGITGIDVLAGEPVELFGVGTRAKYSDGGLTPGSLLYIGAAGVLDTTAAGDPVAVALTTNDILIVRAV